MDKDLELAVQYLENKHELHDINTNLIELCEKYEKEINDNLVILKQEEPYRFSKEVQKKWQETIALLETKADSIHKKILELYEELCNETDMNDKEDKKKRAKETVTKS